MQADRLESQMRVQLEIQEGIDLCLEQRDEELRQLRSQSQSDGAQLAALSLQLQELISSVELRAEVVGRDLEEINGPFDRHRGEINCLKIREKDSKEEVEKLKGFVVGAGHEAQIFKDCLDRMAENICRCGGLPQRLGRSLSPQRTKEGRSCPMLLSERTSMWLLLWRTQFLSQFLPHPPAVSVPPLLFLLWKRSLRNRPSFVRIWMAC